MLKKEHQILKPFTERPWKKYTYREIKLQTNKKSESYTYSTLKKLAEQEILKEEKAGNVTLYSLNTTMKAQAYAAMTAQHIAWSKSLPYKDISKIARKLPTSHYTLLITGSYANNRQTRKSDIDLVIICDDTEDPKRLLAEIMHSCGMNIPKMHPFVFKESEFTQMLKEKEDNYGKETAKNNLILYGGDAYYRMMAGAIRDGLPDYGHILGLTSKDPCL